MDPCVSVWRVMEVQR